MGVSLYQETKTMESKGSRMEIAQQWGGPDYLALSLAHPWYICQMVSDHRLRRCSYYQLEDTGCSVTFETADCPKLSSVAVLFQRQKWHLHEWATKALGINGEIINFTRGFWLTCTLFQRQLVFAMGWGQAHKQISQTNPATDSQHAKLSQKNLTPTKHNREKQEPSSSCLLCFLLKKLLKNSVCCQGGSPVSHHSFVIS